MFVNKSECCYRSQTANRVIQDIEFWFEGVFLVLVGTFGLFGNAMSIAVLSRNEMKNVFNRLLIFLSFIDSIMILFAIMNYSIINAFGVKLEIYNYMFPYFVNPVSNMILCASVFTVIAIAF
ncbi:unnamed protein product [Lepeophtheirus salmonis]|uniref:(salmon louse) hypothetical protein n=2 Tax=Lepeophtheirus salmonis TaxID=72036 RepID=A0A7R8CI21_LEPSM|nr:unnamed protein product [Lepeophtheirus salmonis]CAF2791431.1 unnamed protein product [Lepeophtheirus salmonis]